MNQFDPKQPTTSYEQFQEKCLGEAIRPLNYPLNAALGTSQKFNFSSSKLDFVNYRNSLIVERNDCESVILNRIFRLWYEEAVLAGAIDAYNGSRVPPIVWHWPGFESLDPLVDAQTDHDRLANGTDTYRDFWGRRGFDWREVLQQQAAEQAEIERLGLQFGDPVKRSVTESEDVPSDKGEPAHAA